MKAGLRALAVITAVAWLAAPIARAADPVREAASGGIKVEFNSTGVGPREIEDTTELAIPRDYAAAWNALETALSQNRADILDSGFVGVARERLAQRVADQKKTGLHVRYVDHGHQVRAVFYSPEGSAMQLRDTVSYDLQVLDGNKVIHSQPVTETYIALMTVTEDRWKVRMLEAAP